MDIIATKNHLVLLFIDQVPTKIKFNLRKLILHKNTVNRSNCRVFVQDKTFNGINEKKHNENLDFNINEVIVTKSE